MKSRMTNNFSLNASAKINLSLRVVGRRPNGYHNLQSLMVPLTVGDDLTFDIIPSGFDATCDHSDVPTGEGSLLQRAFDLAKNVLGFEEGLRVVLKKEIPMGAGLGGGSSDAAAVIRAVEKITEKKLNDADFPQVGEKIGADVPFFLAGGSRWVEGIGEKVGALVSLPPMYVLLVYPALSIATPWVYSEFRKQTLTEQKEVASLPNRFESLRELLPYLTNDLESVVLPRYPIIGEIKQKILSLGGDAALMSGSGSTIFGLFTLKDKRDGAIEALKKEEPRWWVCGAEPLKFSGIV